MIQILAILGVLIIVWCLLSKLYETKRYENHKLMATLSVLGLVILIPILIAVIPFVLGIGMILLVLAILVGIVGFGIYGFITYLTRR